MSIGLGLAIAIGVALALVYLPPWLSFALILTLTMALLYQLLHHRLGRRIVFYWLLVFAGFLAAEVIAEVAGWNITRYGDLRILPDILGAFSVTAALWMLGV